MFPESRWRRHVSMCVALLLATLCIASNPESSVAEGSELDVAARQLAGKLLDPSLSVHRPPLASDAEHARTIDPVLTRGATIWIHESLPAPPLTVIGGRVFSYSDVTYDALDAPVLTVRPIDDDQRIPFLVRVVIGPKARIPMESALSVSFPAPPIFMPSVDKLSVRVGAENAEFTVERSLAASTVEVRVQLRNAISAAQARPASSIIVILEGELVLASYRVLAPGRFGGFDDLARQRTTPDLSTLQSGRDTGSVGEGEALRAAMEGLALTSATPYEAVAAVTAWVGDVIRYRDIPAHRSPLEILEDRSGDCDDYVTLEAALLQTIGIPARAATGLLYDLNTLAAHAWLEVALPAPDGVLHWFIVDPTLAGATTVEERTRQYVQLKDRFLLYTMKPKIALEGTVERPTTDVLLNWRRPGTTPPIDPPRFDEFVESVIVEVDQQISRGAERVGEAGLKLRRDSSSIPGSPYIVVERPLARNHPAHLQLRLENEERLALELEAGNSPALESELDLRTIDRMKSVHTDLSSLFFGGEPAHHNLELVFVRDRHSDRLRTVELRFGRYLVEHHLERIIRRLERAELLTEEEAARISAVAEASGWRNLYLLQELARQLPPRELP